YKGHTQVNEWQFHVFDRGLQLSEENPQGAATPTGGGFVGPGFGGKGMVRGQRNSPVMGGPNGMGSGATPPGGKRQSLPPGMRKSTPGDDEAPPPPRR
ncbi:MAG TPA: hypothetical protein VFG08_01325, partial [Candidatus Polarisedimenticolia bacterium]|nr:hypothetical protein [Candidatus Polarisedimenticolia bacterium]